MVLASILSQQKTVRSTACGKKENVLNGSVATVSRKLTTMKLITFNTLNYPQAKTLLQETKLLRSPITMTQI
jgi:hypothetical protein